MKILDKNWTRALGRDIYIFESKSSLFIQLPDLAAQWHPTKNGNLTPHDVTAGSNKKVWWKCSNGHEWEAKINNRTRNIKCPYCRGKKVGENNCLANKKPDLAAQWHPTRNGNLTPHDVTYASHKKVWWKCSNGHEWEAVIKNRYYGSISCNLCANVEKKDKDSLVIDTPEIVEAPHVPNRKIKNKKLNAIINHPRVRALESKKNGLLKKFQSVSSHAALGYDSKNSKVITAQMRIGIRHREKRFWGFVANNGWHGKLAIVVRVVVSKDGCDIRKEPEFTDICNFYNRNEFFLLLRGIDVSKRIEALKEKYQKVSIVGHKRSRKYVGRNPLPTYRRHRCNCNEEFREKMLASKGKLEWQIKCVDRAIERMHRSLFLGKEN